MKIIAKGNIKHDGTLYTKGKTFDIDDEPGQILVDSKVASVVGGKAAKEVPGDDTPTMDWKREQLDEHAESIGITDPQGLPNKEAVFDRIQEAKK